MVEFSWSLKFQKTVRNNIKHVTSTYIRIPFIMAE